MLGLFVRKPVANAATRVFSLARKPARSWLPLLAGLLALIVAAHYIRTPGYLDAKARYVSSSREAVRAEEPGRVAAVLVRQGDRILPGRVVAILENDSLVAVWEEARARAEETSIDVSRALAVSDPAQYQVATHARRAAVAGEAALRATRTRLALASRDGGVVVTPRTMDLIGARLEAGDTILVVAKDERFEVECDLKEIEIGDVEPGQPLSLRLRSDPGREIRGRVERVFSLPPESQGSKTRFRVWGRLDAGHPGIRLGESGIARIEIGRWNVYERLGRSWARLVRADFWL
jgi:multidrug resistance efflux pump